MSFMDPDYREQLEREGEKRRAAEICLCGQRRDAHPGRINHAFGNFQPPREHGRQCGFDGRSCHDPADHLRWQATFARKLKMVDGVPRRNRTDLATPPEAAIRAAMAAVESDGADVRLTKAIDLLTQALDAVADFVDETLP